MKPIRPALLFVAGLVFAGIGLCVAGSGLAGLPRSHDPTALPVCLGDGTGECVTVAAATVRQETDSRGELLLDEKNWLLDVRSMGHEDGKLEVTVPPQPAQDRIATGMPLTVVYYEDHAVLLRLPDGVTVETSGHPRRSAPNMIYLGVGTLGLGWFCLRGGWRHGRRGDWWRRVAIGRPDVAGEVAVGAALFVGGLGGLITQHRAGTSLWPAFLVAIGCATTMGFSLWRVRRRVRAR